MNAKKAKTARRQAQAAAPPVKVKGSRSAGSWTSRKGWLIAVAIVVIVALSFVLPGMLNKKSTSEGAHAAMAMGAKAGEGLPVGAKVPSFSETNLLGGRTISSKSVYNHKTLLFFSEGVMCQACFEQIRGLQAVGDKLAKLGIQLVSITPDSPTDLTQAVAQYGINTPVISDSDRNMSEAFNTLGEGMHADMPGHAFALIDKGKVLWYRDYWLAPYRTMYVEPKKLLADIPSA